MSTWIFRWTPTIEKLWENAAFECHIKSPYTYKRNESFHYQQWNPSKQLRLWQVCCCFCRNFLFLVSLRIIYGFWIFAMKSNVCVICCSGRINAAYQPIQNNLKARFFKFNQSSFVLKKIVSNENICAEKLLWTWQRVSHTLAA